MPPVAAAAASAAFTYATEATIFSLTVGQSAFVVFAGNLAMSAVSQALGKPKMPDAQSFAAQSRDRIQTAKSTTQARTLVLGEAQISGPLSLFESTGTNNEYLNFVIPHADHPSDGIVDYYLNKEKVGTLDGSGNVTGGRFKDYARVTPRLGGFDQAAEPNMVSEVTNWTAANKGGGITDTSWRIKWSNDVWPNGFNQASAQLRGMLCYDPRDSGATIVTSSVASPAVFQTAAAHGFSVDEFIWLKDHTGAVPAVGRMYQVKTVPASDTFTLIDEDGNAVDLSTGGADGTATAMLWTDNWALLVRAYLVHRWGFNAIAAGDDEIDDTVLAATANVCDEQVALTAEPRTFTAADTTDKLTLASDAPWRTGDGCQVSTTDTLPAGLVVSTTYFVIRMAADTIKLATTLENARAGVAIDITDTGTGTHTVTRNSQLRYTANGVITVGDDPIGPLEELMTAAAGVIIWDEGKFKIYAAAATASSGTTDEDDMTSGDLDVAPEVPRSERFNAARGTYVDPDKFWTRNDAPPYLNATYQTEDGGERIFRDFDLPFTDNPVAAQRLFKIFIEKGRQGITCKFPAKPAKLATAVWDVESLSIGHLGWSGKEFRVLSSVERPDFGIDLLYREESSTAYDWALGDETTIDPAPDTNLPDPLNVINPTALVLSSGTAVLDVVGDGTVISRIKAAWSAPADQFVIDGGHIEVQYKKSADSTWIDAPLLAGNVTETYIAGVLDGTNYDLRIRSRNTMGVHTTPETWMSVTNHMVAGKSEPPADTTSFTIDGNTVEWVGPDSEADLAGYVIRFHYGANLDWASATAMHNGVLKSSPHTLEKNPTGSITLLLKAVDTSGNYSTNASKIITNLGDPAVANVVETFAQASAWAGTLANGSIDSGTIVADDDGTLMWNVTTSTPMWDADDSVAFWDGGFVAMTYEATFTVSAAATGSIMTIPFTALGDGISVELRGYNQVMWSADGQSMWAADTGAAMWNTPDYQPFSGLFAVENTTYDVRVSTGASSTQGIFSALTPTIDVPDITETVSDVTIAAGGTRLTLVETYDTIVAVTLTLQDDAGAAVTVKVMDKNAALGPLVQCFDISETGTGGQIDAIIKGY